MTDASRIDIVAPAPDTPHHQASAEVVETLFHGLAALGHPTTVRHRDYGDGTNVLLSTAFARESLPPAPARTVVFNLEQFDERNPWNSEAMRTMLRQHVVWDYSAKNLARMRAKGFAPIGMHVPIGYVPQLTRIESAPQQDIDVLFYGSMNERRDTVLRALGRRGLKVIHAFNAYGEKRDALIARAKVVLNVHYYPAKVFEIVRVSYLLANRKAVVSELDDETDLEPDLRDAVAGVRYDDLADTVEAHVRDDACRHALEQRGFDAFSARPQTTFLARALAELPWFARPEAT
jgi:hypothetical protein